MKILDKFLLKSYLPPFLVTFIIVVFTLTLQILWVYIDDIIGKNLDLWTIAELVSYMMISLIPLAMTIAILISCVMTLGNLGEYYELITMKSTGISLRRIMRPLILMGCIIAVSSFTINNYVIPWANLKFKTRLFDIRRQKPALSLDEGIFNTDFAGYTFYIGSKDKDGQTIRNVMLYKNTVDQKLNVITAQSGKLYTTRDGRYLVMELYDGYQFEELDKESNRRSESPHLRSEFKKIRKHFDLSEFSLSRSNEENFRSHQNMLSTQMLWKSIDSMDLSFHQQLNNYKSSLVRNVSNLSLFKKDTVQKPVTVQVQTVVPPNNPTGRIPRIKSLERIRSEYDSTSIEQKGIPTLIVKNPNAKSFRELFDPQVVDHYARLAKGNLRNVINESTSFSQSIDFFYNQRAKYIFELHLKFALALVCILFTFIGGAMGAIVRKGGFGYPMLIAILFFMGYIIMNTTFKNLAERRVVPQHLAAYFPLLILLPIALFLTYKAMMDRQVEWGFTQKIKDFFLKLITFFKRKTKVIS